VDCLANLGMPLFFYFAQECVHDPAHSNI